MRLHPIALLSLLGIVAGTASAQHHTAAIRSAVADALGLAGLAKSSVLGAYYRMRAFPGSNAQAHYEPATTQQSFAINIGDDGRVIITFTEPRIIASSTIVLTPTAHDRTVTWACKGHGFPTGTLPPRCR